MLHNNVGTEFSSVSSILECWEKSSMALLSNSKLFPVLSLNKSNFTRSEMVDTGANGVSMAHCSYY